MPRIIFDSFEELKKWCKEFVEKGKYTGYTTASDELILKPRKSTRPQRYAYLKSIKVREYAKKLSAIYDIPFFYLETYEWDVERNPIRR